MTRKMWDSTNPFDIPTDAQMVGGYIDGPYAWSQEGWDRFPHAIRVPIATRATTNQGLVGDCETGDMTPDQAVNWILMRRNAGVIPSLYCNLLNTLPILRDLFQTRKIVEPPYWVARYDNKATIPSDCVAKQYANQPLTGGHYDWSIVADYWPGIDEESNMSQEFENRWQQGIGGVRDAGDLYLALITTEQTAQSALAATTELSARVDTLTAKLDALIQQGVSLEADGEITVKPVIKSTS